MERELDLALEIEQKPQPTGARMNKNGSWKLVSETEPGAWARSNADFVNKRTPAASVAAFIHQLTTSKQKTDCLEELDQLVRIFSFSRKKFEVGTLEESVPEHSIALLTQHQRDMLKLLWENEGKPVSAESLTQLSRIKKKNENNTEQQVIDSLKRMRKKLRLLNIGEVFKHDEGFMLLATQRGISAETLKKVHGSGGSKEIAKLLEILTEEKPSTVTNENIARSIPGTPTHFSKKASALNDKTGHTPDFLIQAERKTGYKIWTKQEVPVDWLTRMKKLKLWGREGEMLVHILTFQNDLITREELLPFFEQGAQTTPNAFRTKINNFAKKIEKAGIILEPIYNEDISGRPIVGYSVEVKKIKFNENGWEEEEDKYKPMPKKLQRKELKKMRLQRKHMFKEVIKLQDQFAVQNLKECQDAAYLIPTESLEVFQKHIQTRSTGDIARLIGTVQKTPENDQDANSLLRHLQLYERHREVLLNGNMAFVKYLFQLFRRKVRVKHDETADYISAGMYGLLQGIEKYNPQFGAQLSTYAGWWIDREFWNHYISTKRGIKLPSEVRSTAKKIIKKIEQAEVRGERLSVAEAAKLEGIDIETATLAMQADRPATSLNMSVGRDEDSSLGGLIGGGEELNLRMENKEQLLQWIDAAGLTNEERFVLIQIKGLQVLDETIEGPMKPEEVANLLSKSKEQVRQIFKLAMRKIKNAMQAIKGKEDAPTIDENMLQLLQKADLDPLERQVIDLKISGERTSEISEKLHLTTTYVEELLKLIQRKIKKAAKK